MDRRPLVENHLLRLLLDLGEVREPFRHEFEAHGVIVSVQVTPEQSLPTADSKRALTPCEADILDLLGRPGSPPLTWRPIQQALEAEGKLYAESTIRKALARLVGAGLLTNRRNHVGYRRTPS